MESPPPSEKAKPPLSTTKVWRACVKRFRKRARAPGHKNARPLWEEAMEQVSEGLLSEPPPLSVNGDLPHFSLGTTNVAFRFGVTQGAKLRACDDLRNNLVNLRTAVLTPITLPTWGRLAQIAKFVSPSSKNWHFLKGDHASAYKQLPLGPQYANLTIVALRNPDTGLWMGFIPKVLLFGEVSAVIHYNCFPRCLAVLINEMLGIPMLSYFGDYGDFPTETVSREALSTFDLASGSLGMKCKIINIR